jgi:NIPSNAP
MCRLFLAVITTAFVTAAFADEPETKPVAPVTLRLYELRAIQASPGRLDALHSRLRDHQIPLLEQHGIFTQAVFVPAGDKSHDLVYLLTAAEGLGPMEKGWTEFRKDPKWLQVIATSEKEGIVVAKEDYQRLVITHWSPGFAPEKSSQSRVFELRTYRCPDPSKHAALMRRFTEHTMKLFEKHGMQNIVYWVPDEEPESQQRLVYLLAHKSQEAAKESFAAFRADPDWLAAKKASEETAGGSLTVKDNGVVSEFLVPAAYSPLK